MRTVFWLVFLWWDPCGRAPLAYGHSMGQWHYKPAEATWLLFYSQSLPVAVYLWPKLKPRVSVRCTNKSTHIPSGTCQVTHFISWVLSLQGTNCKVLVTGSAFQWCSLVTEAIVHEQLAQRRFTLSAQQTRIRQIRRQVCVLFDCIRLSYGSWNNQVKHTCSEIYYRILTAVIPKSLDFRVKSCMSIVWPGPLLRPWELITVTEDLGSSRNVRHALGIVTSATSGTEN